MRGALAPAPEVEAGPFFLRHLETTQLVVGERAGSAPLECCRRLWMAFWYAGTMKEQPSCFRNSSRRTAAPTPAKQAVCNRSLDAVVRICVASRGCLYYVKKRGTDDCLCVLLTLPDSPLPLHPNED